MSFVKGAPRMRLASTALPSDVELEALIDAIRLAPVPCQNSDDPDLWFGKEVAARRRAVVLCQPCQAAPQCLAYGRASGAEYGVWGGVDVHYAALAAR